jgi:hypothetical protein
VEKCWFLMGASPTRQPNDFARTWEEKGDRSNLPERLGGWFAQAEKLGKKK